VTTDPAVSAPGGSPDAALDALDVDWLTLPDLAERLDLPLTRVRQWVRDGALVTVERGPRRVAQVPADFVVDGELARGLSGTLTVLADAGYRPAETVRWLMTPDEALGARPLDLLRAGRHTAVKRLAMTLAF
jgi:hypothetical protein